MARRSSRRNAVRQGQLLSKVRYGPEESALRQLQKQAEDTALMTIQTEKGAASAIENVTRSAIPTVGKVYSEALSRSQTPSIAQGAIDAGGPLFQAAAARERSGTQARIAESGAGAQADLQARRVSAKQGAASALKQAIAKLNSDLAKLSERSTDLAGEKGTFVAATANDLLAKEADRDAALAKQDDAQRFTASENAKSRRITEANSKETARHNRATERGNGSGGKEGRQKTRERTESFRSYVNIARTSVGDLNADGTRPRGQVGNALLRGYVEVPREQTKGKPAKDPRKIELPSFGGDTGKYKDLAASVALDLHYDGHLSRRNLSRMRQQGIKVPRDWAKKPTGKLSPAKRQPVDNALKTLRGTPAKKIG